MNRILCVFCVVFISSFVIVGQGSTDYNKNEFFVGGMVQRIDTTEARIPLDSNRGYGFDISYVRNISRYFGIKGDISGAFGSTSLRTNVSAAPDFAIKTEEKRRIYNFLGGVQLKDNASDDRFKPVAHVLIGVGQIREEFSNTCLSGDCPDSTLFRNAGSTSGFAAALGSGLDIKISDKIGIRAIVDYNPIYSNGRLNNNARFSFGVVF